MTLEERRKLFILKSGFFYRIAIFLKITDTYFIKRTLDNYRVERDLNPYNPLSYIVLLIFAPMAIIKYGYKNLEFKKCFKYR